MSTPICSDRPSGTSNNDPPFDYCRRIALGHYENFPVGWFVPRRQAKYLYALYAFARTADDFADEARYEGARLQCLDDWQRRLDAAAQGEADHPLFAALVRLFRETPLPPAPFSDLLTAFRWDATKKSYRDYGELEDYCRYSANPIGRAVLILFGCDQPEVLKLSDKICTGIQLVNHWQDIAVDLKKDRVYLPQEDLKQFRYPLEDLKKGRITDPFRDLMRFEIDRTRSLFREGRPLLGKLPRRLRWQVELMWSGPLRILTKIERVDFDVFRRRPVLSRKEVFSLFLRHRLGRI